MDTQPVKRKRRRLTISIALVGFLITAVIWAYSELGDSSDAQFNFTLWSTFMALCPPSLLTVPLIDP